MDIEDRDWQQQLPAPFEDERGRVGGDGNYPPTSRAAGENPFGKGGARKKVFLIFAEGRANCWPDGQEQWHGPQGTYQGRLDELLGGAKDWKDRGLLRKTGKDTVSVWGNKAEIIELNERGHEVYAAIQRGEL